LTGAKEKMMKETMFKCLYNKAVKCNLHEACMDCETFAEYNSSERSVQPQVSRHEVIFTKAEALLVKTWYIHGATMRRVSELIAEHFPEKQCNGDNQIEGRFILQESGEILNEDWNKWK